MSITTIQNSRTEPENAYQRLRPNISTDDPKTAIIEIRSFLKIYPDVALAYNDLGNRHLQKGEKMLALAYFEKANRMQPDTPDIVLNLADFYGLELGWTDEAQSMLTNLLRSYPEKGSVLAKLAVYNEKPSIRPETRAFNNDPSKPACSGSPAAIPEKPGPDDRICSQNSETPPGHPEAEGVEELLSNLRATIDNALLATERQLPSNSSDQVDRIAQEYAETGDASVAIAELERILARDPANAHVHNDLGVLYIQSGNLESACSHQETAVQFDPWNPLYRKNLASLYYSCLGKTDEAIELYMYLLSEYPDDVETLSALAIISESNNLREQARTFIIKVLNLEPWNSEARAFLDRL